MFDWFKSERRERRKKVRQDRKQLEVRARRFLKSYLEADEVRKPEFYRAVEDISKKCRPPEREKSVTALIGKTSTWDLVTIVGIAWSGVSIDWDDGHSTSSAPYGAGGES
jgi:hypothetical protein